MDFPNSRDLASPYLVTDSSGDVAHLHPTGLSDADASPVEIPDADVNPWAKSQSREMYMLSGQKLSQHWVVKTKTSFCPISPSKQQGGGGCDWLSKSTLKTCTSGWLL